MKKISVRKRRRILAAAADSAQAFIKMHQKACFTRDGGVSIYGDPPKSCRCQCGAQWPYKGLTPYGEADLGSD